MIAAAIAFVFRWEVSAASGDTYRLDRWTVNIIACSAPTAVRLTAPEYGLAVPLSCDGTAAAEFMRNRE